MARPRRCLERDVVVRGRAGARADRLRREVRRVGRDIRVRREAVVVAAAALAALVTAAQELDGLGDDLDGLALGAVLGLPLAPVKAPVDADRATLGQEARAVLALGAPDRDAEVVGLVDPLARGVLTPAVGGDPQRADAVARLEAPELRVARQVPSENHAVDVGCRHGGPALLSAIRDSLTASLRAGSEGSGENRRFLRTIVTKSAQSARERAQSAFRYPVRSGAAWRLASRARGAQPEASQQLERFSTVAKQRSRPTRRRDR